MCTTLDWTPAERWDSSGTGGFVWHMRLCNMFVVVCIISQEEREGNVACWNA